jgi:hypothetical protein
MYNTVIKWWLNNSSLFLFIIDSGDHPFATDIEDNKERVRISHFDQTKFAQPPYTNSSTLELISLDKAYDAFHTEFEKFDFVFKITCKYTLPDLESVLNKTSIADDIDIILQHRHNNRNMQNTELIGFKTSKFQEFIDNIKKQSHHLFEFKICAFVKAPPLNIKTMRLPRLTNTSKNKRGAGDILTYL